MMCSSMTLKWPKTLQRISTYLRMRRAWVVIDQEGVIRYMRTNEPRDWQPPNDEILKVLSELK